ncbi:hypothetical protein [Glutamicibacter arilaitensis]|uniref:hypothetical protein n=1 Tax=Glutamicibacter arilaitensis TaxID=256701 RepID=UPI003F8DCE70
MSQYRPRIIGIVGADGAGKSTVGDIIEDLLLGAVDAPESVKRTAFAADLKRMLRELDPMLGARKIGMGVEAVRLSDLIEEGYSEDDIKRAYPEYRRALRALGTDCLRGRDKHFWVDQLVRRDLVGMDRSAAVVIDDIRFVNEAQALLSSFEAPSRIIRVVGRGKAVGPGEEVHEIPADYAIDNTGTIEQTRAELKVVFAAWGWSH